MCMSGSRPAGVVPVAERHHRAAGAGHGRARSAVRAEQLAAARLLAAAGDVPRDDGPAAHPRALLHQPRRPRRPAHDCQGARAAIGSSTCFRRSTARSAGSWRRSLHHRSDRRRRPATLPRTAWPGTVGTLLDGGHLRGRLRRVPVDLVAACWCRSPGRLSHDVWPRVRHRVPSGVAVRHRHFRVAAVAGDGDPGRCRRSSPQQVDICILVGLGVRDRRQHLLSDVPARDLVDAA